MQRTQINETQNLAGQEVNLYGWVNVRRDQGKIIFIDLRDRSGVVQMVFVKPPDEIKSPEVRPQGDSRSDLYNLYDLAEKLRPEWVIRVKGLVKERPEKMVNPDVLTGKVEIEPLELEILNEAETSPFPLDTDGYEIDEEARMKYRYQDLRRPRLLNNFSKRHEMVLFIRNWLSEKGFLEIETPILTKSTPEGARDYVVPSRFYAGKFFALPQSPQQYKQLLMVAGVEKYFQIARCFRDEDTRGDRQPEFTQLDLEMSFVEKEDVMDLNEKLLIDFIKTVYPEKKIQDVPFPRISYKEAMKKYGTDRPDLRKDPDNSNLLAFCWVVDFPFFSAEGGPASGGETKWTFTHNPFSLPQGDCLDDLMNKKNLDHILASQYDIVLNGWEIGGGSIRSHKHEILEAVFEIIGYSKKQVEDNFGHMIQALKYGAPPHGGIAWGLDRLVSVLQGEPNIREVIAFPKTGDARDLMMESPSELEEEQLKELHIKVSK